MARVFVCGEALIDFVPRDLPDGQGFIALPGGSPFNTAKAAALAGAETVFMGALSNDLFGERLTADLKNHGVSVSLAPRSEDPTTLAFVDTSLGDPRYAFFDRQSASATMCPSFGQQELASSDILAVGSISLIPNPGADNIVALAMESSQKLMVAFDPNVRANMIQDRDAWENRVERLFSVASIVKISREDLDYLRPGQDPAAFASSLLDIGCALVVVTDGGAGAYGWTRSGHAHAVPPKVEIVDTVGAGDTFMGNLLAGVLAKNISGRNALMDLSDDQIGALMTQSAWAAALNCTRMGCMPPTLDETLEAMAQNG